MSLTQSVHAQIDHARRQVQVVVQVVLLRRGHARYNIGPLDEAAGGLRRLHAQCQILNVVQGIKHSKNVDTTLIGLLAELVDDVVRVRV